MSNDDACTNLNDEVNSLNDASGNALITAWGPFKTAINALYDPPFWLSTLSFNLVHVSFFV